MKFFTMLGTFVGKALLDRRLLDIPLSRAFYKWIIGQDLQFEDFALVFPSVAQNIAKLLYAVKHKRAILADESLVCWPQLATTCCTCTCRY
jgi:E3 ubiquitin-protein ligase TRIP12